MHKRQPKQPKKSKKQNITNGVYFERQFDSDNCRMHAINNALGRPALTIHKFWALCDKYDQKNNTKGSRTFFLVNGHEDNLLTFILRELNVPFQYDYQIIITEEILSSKQAIICFGEKHVWALRKIQGSWYLLDSLNQKPTKSKPTDFKLLAKIQTILL